MIIKIFFNTINYLDKEVQQRYLLYNNQVMENLNVNLDGNLLKYILISILYIVTEQKLG